MSDSQPPEDESGTGREQKRTVRGGRFTHAGEDYAYVTVPQLRFDVVRELTQAEREIAELAFRGASSSEIARQRGTSANTVNNQLTSIFSRLGVTNRHEFVALLARRLAGSAD